MTLVELLDRDDRLARSCVGGALTTFDGFNRNQRDERRAQRHDRGRAQRARRPGAPAAQPRQARVEPGHRHAVAPYDLIFQTSDPAPHLGALLPQHVDAAGVDASAPACGRRSSPSRARRPPRRSRPRCGPTARASGWSSTAGRRDYVTNRRGGADRPMFQYTCTVGTTCTSTAGDLRPGRQHHRPAARRHDARPQRAGAARRQRASTCATRTRRRSRASSSTRSSTSRTVVLNAAGSTDYEGRTLDYYWFKTTHAGDGQHRLRAPDGHGHGLAADAVGGGRLHRRAASR